MSAGQTRTGEFVHHREVAILLLVSGLVISLMPWYVFHSSFGPDYYESMLSGLMALGNVSIEFIAFLYFLGLGLVLVGTGEEYYLVVFGMALVLLSMVLGGLSESGYDMGLGFALAIVLQLIFWYAVYGTAKPQSSSTS